MPIYTDMLGICQRSTPAIWDFSRYCAFPCTVITVSPLSPWRLRSFDLKSEVFNGKTNSFSILTFADRFVWIPPALSAQSGTARNGTIQQHKSTGCNARFNTTVTAVGATANG